MLASSLRPLLVLSSVVTFAAAAAGQTAPDAKTTAQQVDVQRFLSWLPADTETVIAARNFSLPDPKTLEKTRHYTQEFMFASLALRPWGINAPLAEFFKNQKVHVAVEGARKFRPPKSLGFMRFEGCIFIAFADEVTDRVEEYFKSVSSAALRVEDVEGRPIMVFQDRSESDTWTTFVSFVGPNMLLVATDIDYLREALARIQGKSDSRALPETLPEWGYVDTSAQFWGLRHFDRSQRDEDPSSPFWDPSKFVKSPWTDEQAIGLTFSYDPATGKGPTITYLSGNPSVAKELLSLRYEGDKFRSTVRELDARAIAGSYSIGHPEAIMFTFYLTCLLGHCIFL